MTSSLEERRWDIKESARWIFQDLVGNAGGYPSDDKLRQLAQLAVKASVALQDAIEERFPS